jgi:hypothetical protein
MTPRGAAFRGNKAALPSKPCVACGRAMSRRRDMARQRAELAARPKDAPLNLELR